MKALLLALGIIIAAPAQALPTVEDCVTYGQITTEVIIAGHNGVALEPMLVLVAYGTRDDGPLKQNLILGIVEGAHETGVALPARMVDRVAVDKGQEVTRSCIEHFYQPRHQ